MVGLAGGWEVPRVCVEALDKFDEEEWPGASFAGARAAIAHVVIEAYKKEARR